MTPTAKQGAPALPPGPTGGNARFVILLGVTALLGLISLGSGATVLPAFILSVCAFAAWRRVRGRGLTVALQRTQAALEARMLGRTEEAEAHLDAIPARALRNTVVRRDVAIERAMNAFYRSDLQAALRAVEPATSDRTRLFTHTYELTQRATALSVRALVHASTGNAGRANADVVEVLASAYADPRTLARARLAEAVALVREGKLDALAAHLRAHGGLILEHTQPRERVLARALRKMVQSRARSVYREAAKPAADDAPTHASWVAQIAPSAAAFLRESRQMGAQAEPPPAERASAEGLHAVAASRAAARRGAPKAWKRILTVWTGLVGMFVGFWLLQGGTSTSGEADAASAAGDGTPFVALAMALLVAALAARIGVLLARRRRADRSFLSAQRLEALGDGGGAEQILTSLAAGAKGLTLAQVCVLRAFRAEKSARFAECVDLCERALGLLAALPSGLRGAASVTLTPAMVACRGAALAAVGRTDEALAELDAIAKQHAAWSSRAVAEVRIRLLAAVRRGDLETARAVARGVAPELPMSLRDEVLADLVLATAPDGSSREEQERLDAELRDDASLRTWIDAVAPGMRDELARRVAGGVRVAREADEPAEELREERDVLARGV
jgi:hypothetical protein